MLEHRKKVIFKWAKFALVLAVAYGGWGWMTTDYDYYPSGALRLVQKRTPKIFDWIFKAANTANGHFTIYYENGKKEEEGYYYISLGLDGHAGEDGKHTWWAENGRIVDQWVFKNGNPVDGTRTSFYDNGAKKEEITYKDGLENGPHIVWGPNGRILDRWVFVMNVPVDGQRIILYPDGTKSDEYNYRNGKEDGKQYSWYPDGKPHSDSTYVNGTASGVQKAWDSNGHFEGETIYENVGTDKIETNICYYKNNVHRDLNRWKNNTEGFEQIWYRNGQLKVQFAETHYGLNGLKLTFYPDGTKRSEENWKADESNIEKMLSHKQWSNPKYSYDDFQEVPENEK